MTEIKSLTGKWKGQFTLGENYESEEGESVDFILYLLHNDGVFNGICIDNQVEGLFSEPITVNGFWDNELISFTKQYPFLYYPDEKGKLIIDRSRKHPEISYTGEFDNIQNCYSGEFILIEDSIPLADGGYLELELSGTWTMKKIDDENN
jgi:hypothetical protein